jgi:putative ABC transport system ATP-binding protein
VAIARALINDPAFILADEPTGNLDSKTGNDIRDILLRINDERKATVVIVTHNLELADSSQRIFHMRDGVIEKETIGASWLTPPEANQQDIQPGPTSKKEP